MELHNEGVTYNVQCRDVRKSIIKQVLGKSRHLSSKFIKGIKINER